VSDNFRLVDQGFDALQVALNLRGHGFRQRVRFSFLGPQIVLGSSQGCTSTQVPRVS
jgi:hypothetical protein